MPKYSAGSLAKLDTCDPRLQRVFKRAIEIFDNKIIYGHRGEVLQNKAFETGHSDKRWPDSNHNELPSKAIDALPWPVDWKDLPRMRFFAGHVMAIAAIEAANDNNIWALRWGGDWDSDTDLNDQTWNDLAHFEIVEVG